MYGYRVLVEQGERGRETIVSRRGALAFLALVGVVALGPLWWRAVRSSVHVPATPVEAAREGLPRILARVAREPRSVDARLELVAAYALLGDRLGAWQQLCIAEEQGGSPDAVRRARTSTLR